MQKEVQQTITIVKFARKLLYPLPQSYNVMKTPLNSHFKKPNTF